MKNSYLTILTLFITSATLWGQHSAYQPGEKITYEISYGFITAGVASLEIVSETVDNRELWHSKMVGRTTGMAEAVFKVLDVYEVYMDPETELPVKSIRNIREGRYRRYNVVDFDHTSRSDSAVLNSNLTGKHITQKGIHDILSCFYWYRNNIFPDQNNYIPGKTTTVNTWFTDEFYPVILKYIGTEDVKTKKGKIKCYKFNPVSEVGRLFKTQEDVSIWFSADKNFLPVKIRFDIFVGAFTVEMTSSEGLKYPLEIVKK